MIRQTKHVIIVGDGMADYPLEALGGRTPLMAAKPPNLDWMAKQGEVGIVKTIPDGFSPGSEIANLSIFGYDPNRYYTGRGPLEAASMGITLGLDDLAFRCNLVTLQKRGTGLVMEDFSAGHITDKEATQIIVDLNKELGTDEIQFYPGVSYRHLMVWKEGAARISGERMAETILVSNYKCKGCPIGCGREIKIEKGRFAGVEGAGPEYETIANFGSMCLIDDLEAIAKANEMCNRYGLDTMSTGACIAFAMEAYEKGLLTKKALGGIELEWGNGEAMLQLVGKIAEREDFGEILGRGVREAAKVLGPKAEEFAIHVKGLEISAHDPRAFHSAALGYATGNRGGCHLQGGTHWAESSVAIPELGWEMPYNRFGTEGKGEMVAKMQNLMSLFDALGVCKFSLFGGVRPHHMVDWLNGVTGWNYNLQEFMQTGERLYNLKRLYNVRRGISRKDDTLPMRLFTHRRNEGGTVRELPNLGTMLSDYYEYRCWSEEGIPTQQKLAELDLTDYAVI